MIKLLKIFSIIIILFLGIVVYKNIAEKRATEKTPLPDRAVLGSGDYIRNLTTWPKRSYDIHIPSSYDVSWPTPVVLVLHGGGASSENAAKLTCPNGDLNSTKCLNKLADREGFIVVYPNGTSRPLIKNLRTWNAGGGENGYMCVGEYACKNKIDDISYFKDLLDNLSKTINVDRARVYATGISNGAAMSHRLACELSDWIVAIAAVGGGNQFSAVAQCKPSQPVSVLEIHGTSDPAWPYDGGTGTKEGGNFYSVSQTVSGWTARNQCSSEPIKETMPDLKNDGTKSIKESYGGCRKDSNVVLITVNNGGHTWPQGNQYLPERAIGKTGQDFSANEVIWQFFKVHPRETNQAPSSQNNKIPGSPEVSTKEKLVMPAADHP